MELCDQANDLRRLVRDTAVPRLRAHAPRPRLVIVASGKGGVGTTTVAVNLAVSMARRACDTVLVDADGEGGDAALLCGLEERCSLADVLSGRRTVGEALQPGPGGIRVLPGKWGWQGAEDGPPSAGAELLGQLSGLRAPADAVVVDAGNSPSRLLRQLWQAADLALVVTTREAAAIIDGYALIKTVANADQGPPVHLLVNLEESATDAEEVYGRLAEVCRRFLAVELISAGHLPPDQQVAQAADRGEPFVIAAPGCPAARAMERVVENKAWEDPRIPEVLTVLGR